jgi:acetyl esterase
MFYPVADANFETGSYLAFAQGTNLTRDAMRWFWDAYLPEAGQRQDPLASPLQASLEQLAGLPPALVMVAEYDDLGTVHDFVMLNGLADTPAARGAVAQAVAWLREAFRLAYLPGRITLAPDLAEDLAEP